MDGRLLPSGAGQPSASTLSQIQLANREAAFGEPLALRPSLGPATMAGSLPSRPSRARSRMMSEGSFWPSPSMVAITGCGLKIYWRQAYLALPYFTSVHRYLPAPFLTYGHEIAYEPVNDRLRLKRARRNTPISGGP